MLLSASEKTITKWPIGKWANHASSQGSALEEIPDTSDKSYSATPPAREHSRATSHASTAISDPEDSNLRPRRSDIDVGICLYFMYCHRQPIWCFEREEVSDPGLLPEELACSILALTSRWSEKQDQLRLNGDNAKSLVMLRIANDGNFHLGQFHLGLAFQLCQSAMLDLKSCYDIDDPAAERKKRLFWSLQVLEQFYGRQIGLLTVPTEIWQPRYSSADGGQLELDPKAPPLPMDELGCSAPHEPGIWNTSVHLAWVWSQVRKYVSNCSQNILKEPWRHDSMYAKVLSDFMETENMIPMCHRYDSAKFYKRKVEELRVNRDYWAPWLKEQFMYHAIPTVLNHPFLYIVGAQHNPNLAIPNTFWRRSSELALLHATWIVRMIDMVVEKEVPLTDPFFGHVAAIAATVHLYYCCSAATRLRYKSNTDFAKCKRFLKGFTSSSAACGALDRSLAKMTRMAAGPESMDVEDWMPSKIYLSVPLMWEILQFSFTEDSPKASFGGLLDNSLAPTVAHEVVDESSTLEIIVATSPEITIDTADGGQEAPTLPFKGFVPSSRNSPWTNPRGKERSNEQTDILTFNFTPWLYADSSQLTNLGDTADLGIGDMGNGGSQTAMIENRGKAWWEDENYSNVMFNNF
ncbi:hypothetical protein DL766_000189 [Monosporascus sp. MC13-8B]|uniref:Transcription factor domain-containing protein n=1 Tax=Monosporascus cannonballus TaxID=155416 RepID=A0ABY0H1T3_9PEZI|nr:hypothetical protein DL762_006551 [Monosporascus cannonballus]RYP39747.1 hypothetical protein DL766_000189 [Monosporascus sp. MC13-8B]